MSVYAVRLGKKTGKFDTWRDCAKYVMGVSGAEYKKFDSEEEADKYLGLVKRGSGITGLTAVVTDKSKSRAEDYRWIPPSELSSGEAVAYVDGSFLEDYGAYGFGCVYTSLEGKKVFSGSDCNSALIGMRNISGELVAAMYAVKVAVESGAKQLTIVHDYAGIANWVLGTWSAKSDIVRAYKSYMLHYMKTMPIFFKWVKGHSGAYGGDQADYAAKSAIKNNRVFDSASLFEGYYDFTEVNCGVSSLV